MEPSSINDSNTRLDFYHNMQALDIRNRLMNFPGSTDEHRSLDFFYTQTAPVLSGYFDGDFWQTLLPQIGCSEPSVQHAMIALAALQEHSVGGESHDVQTSRSRFAIAQYNKAIRLLNRRISNEPQFTAVPLTSCVLFICLEFLRGNLDEALKHFESGLAIVKAQRSKNPPSNITAQESSLEITLAEIFSRLCIQASLCGRQWFPLPIHSPSIPCGPYDLSTAPFTSLSEARNEINILMNDAHGFIRSTLPFKFASNPEFPDDFSIALENLLRRIHTWKARFDIFMTISSSTPKLHDIRGLVILRILYAITLIWASTSLECNEMAWDEHAENFHSIISLAASLTGVSTNQLNSPSWKERKQLKERVTLHDIFTFEMGAIPVVYFTALKCRCPRLRRQAVHLLSIMRPRREGLWDSRQLAGICKRVIELEEGIQGMVDDERLEMSRDRILWPVDGRRVYDVVIVADYLDNKRVQRLEFKTRPLGQAGSWNVWTEDLTWDASLPSSCIASPTSCTATPWGWPTPTTTASDSGSPSLPSNTPPPFAPGTVATCSHWLPVCVWNPADVASTTTTASAPTGTCSGSIPAPTQTHLGIHRTRNMQQAVEQQDGMYCQDMTNVVGITLTNLYELNLVLGDDCSGLSAGYAYCVGVAHPLHHPP
ncbi:hypothetical protein B7463_g3342, partial [Scytalidium lignicola]